MIRRLLPLVGVLLAITSTAARAETPGLSATGHSADLGTTCYEGTLTNLARNYGQGPLETCPGDRVTFTLTGSVWSPGLETAWFAGSDDGLRLWLDGDLVIDDWYPRSCSGRTFTPALPTGWHDIRIEFFEDGGDACLYVGQLRGNIWTWLGEADLATSAPALPTTEPATTSTESSTTSTTPPTSTEPPHTSVAPSSTYLDSTTTTNTIQTVQTTTTGVQSTTTYQPVPSSSAPTDTAPSPTSIQEPETTSTLSSTTSLATVPIPSTIPNVTTTTYTPATVPEDLTPAEAYQTVLDSVDELTADTAGEVFAALDVESLTTAQGDALTAAVQDAPIEIRELFEENVNIFAGVTDNYVPLGSTVPVRTRRVIIITTGLLVAMPAPSTRRPR